ncbi:OLC1v1004387C1 [Oldenlandia corymbosa var. corymbosa]|uniref:OLC1v1004387C1 n=1 Tax=Oldenlandia corymbosa var. corymbosa TaxID=529605 RepID=A0AAV1DEK8_OLDCO|nr:OLC1v1004387C1 [Oldenlandia corymbosa var. corymbosa]
MSAIPDAAVTFLLENIKQAVSYYGSLIVNAQSNVLELQRQLEDLKRVMSDFSRYNHDSDVVKGVVKDIKDIIHEAEDAVDVFVVYAAEQKARNWMEKLYHKATDYPKKLVEVGESMNGISKRIQKIQQDGIQNGIKLLDHQAIINLSQPDDTASTEGGGKKEPEVEQENVIGFDDATKEVQGLLTEGPEELEIVTIVGMLGLGKTTLATKVFKDPKVDYEFMIQNFVYVSKEYKKKEVLLKILESVTDPTEHASKGEKDLEKLVCQELSGKQYLIVLDDIWEPADWDDLKGAFPKNNKRCRVLITTRHKTVAKRANPNKDPYELQFLPMDKSLELLDWKIFKGNKCPQHLQDFETKIAEKCDGLPLALVVLAGILVNDPDSVELWSTVAESVKDYIAKKMTETGKVLGLMYKHLPNELKLCFLYLGLFREDFEIPVWKLVRLWIAEGLIQKDGGHNLEFVAEKFVEELVSRNLVMVGKRRSNGKIQTCRMHDTLRDFCKTAAEEENLFEEITEKNLNVFLSGDPTKLDKYRRICINNISVKDYLSSKSLYGKHVRSFLTFVDQETLLDLKCGPQIPKTFKLLRVLEAESLIFQRYPIDMPTLILLKYLAISVTFENLPESMSGLRNLETLIVRTTNSPNLSIKWDIWKKMPQFKHLHTNASTTFPSPSCGRDQNGGGEIQTLSTISPESCREEVFKRSPRLRKLGIFGRVAELFDANGNSDVFGYLSGLKHLQNLKLLNDNVELKLKRLPMERYFPRMLMKLTLQKTFLEWKEMSILGKLEFLEVLKLKEFAFEGVRWDTEKDSFKRLKHLHIGRTDLAYWAWEPQGFHFPELRSLKLMGCYKLEELPKGLAEIPNLQSLALHSTHRTASVKARMILTMKLRSAPEKGSKNKKFNLSIYPPEY